MCFTFVRQEGCYFGRIWSLLAVGGLVLQWQRYKQQIRGERLKNIVEMIKTKQKSICVVTEVVRSGTFAGP